MCFTSDASPPIAPISGAAIDNLSLELTAADGNRLAAFRAFAAAPSGAGMIVLPDVRGLFGYYEELALRFAEIDIDAISIDYYGRTAGASRRDAEFEYVPHTRQTTWAGLQADIGAAADELRAKGDISSLFTVGFCFGGRASFLSATIPDVELSGVIGFYGWPVGASRNDTPAPADVAGLFRAPVLGLFGGADKGIPASAVSTFDDALTAASVEHRLVTYDAAPHSFFDRTQEQFADESAAAWAEIRDFVATNTSSRNA